MILGYLLWCYISIMLDLKFLHLYIDKLFTATGILCTFAKKFFKLLIVQLKGTFLFSTLYVYLFFIKIYTKPVPFFIIFCYT
jgi:hypothetical protein